MIIPSPIDLLLGLLVLTGVARFISDWDRRRTRLALARLARDTGMHYSASDRLNLTPRVAGHFPIIGAAAVRVSDVLYRSDAHRHAYIFMAEYTGGVVRAKRRVRRVAAFSEERARGNTSAPIIELAPAGGHFLEQYRHMLALIDDRASERA